MLEEGLTYTHEIFSTPPLHIHILQMDLLNFRLSLRPLIAWDRIGALETIPSMAQRYGAIAGINGSFFNRQSGASYPVGYLMVHGKLIYKSDIHRPSFAVTSQRSVVIDYFKPHLFLETEEHRKLALHFINRPLAAVGITLYSPHYGISIQAKGSRTALLSQEGVKYRVEMLDQVPQPLDANERLLVFSGASQRLFPLLHLGALLQIDEFIPPLFSDVVHLMTGGPTLLREGKIVRSYRAERFGGAFLRRQPRSAMGVTADNQVLLVAVDGRDPGYSVGATFEELSRILLAHGAVSALGLDSGGSSTLYAKGKVLNRASDGAPRPVANGWFVFKDRYLY